MKLETMLDALIMTYHEIVPGVHGSKRLRQYRKFRDWIIRLDERMKMRIQMFANYEPSWMTEWLNDPNEDAAWTELGKDGEVKK